MPGVVAVIQTFGDRINFHSHIMDYLEFISRVTSHIPDKGEGGVYFMANFFAFFVFLFFVLSWCLASGADWRCFAFGIVPCECFSPDNFLYF